MKPNLTGLSSLSSLTSFTPMSLESSGLREHFDHCKQSGGRFFIIRCGAEAMKSFMSTRLVTCAVVVALFIGISSLAV